MIVTPDTTRPATTGRPSYVDTPVDVRLVLSSLWVAMLFVFAYVDIFGFFRADVLTAAIDGEVSGIGLDVDQVFLLGAFFYILLPCLMVVLALVLPPRASRVTNIAMAALYAATIIASCVGETWVYYLAGSAVEVLLLLAVARTAWRWPHA